MGVQSQIHAPAALPSGKDRPVPTELEARRAYWPGVSQFNLDRGLFRSRTIFVGPPNKILVSEATEIDSHQAGVMIDKR